MMDDLGAAFTGQSPTDPATASGQWDAWLERPGNRSALLQMGLQMMQPVAIGQTTMGHIGQAIGAGGEAMTRASDADTKERLADSKIAFADEKLRIAQQNADSSGIRANAAAARATGKKVGGLTDLFKARAAREDERNFERQLDKDAADLVKQANDVLADKDSPVVQKYKGKSKIEVRDMLRAERPKPKYGAVPTNADDTATAPSSTPAAASAAGGTSAPYPGAKQAADGNWYVQKDGKYYRVK